jgi:hypothetical protein
MSEEIKLNVSLGEALDKLTILDIKLKLIKDEKKLFNIKKEYDIVYDKLQTYVEKYIFYYNILKKVNLYIWEMMELLRDGNIDDTEYLKLCKETIIGNDMRFRVKDKINCISNSLLKEQKGYIVTKVFFDIFNVEIENIIKSLHYYSLIYDEIYIYCLERDAKILKEIFYNQPVIILTDINEKEKLLEKILFQKKIIVDNDKLIYQKLELNKEIIDKFI